MPKASSVLWFYYRFLFKTYKKKVERVPDDVEKLFYNYSQGDHKLRKEKLQKYLIERQKVNEIHAEDVAQYIINKTNLKGGCKHCRRKGLSVNGFFQYLLSHDNFPLCKEDLNESGKLAHYYVYTSHHSYLKQGKDNQQQHRHIKLFEDSFEKNKTSNTNTPDEKEKKKVHCNTHAIVKALKNGVRVIELDLHPSSTKSKIYVDDQRSKHHSSVTLRDCLKVVNEMAFQTSPFPLILILVVPIGQASDLQEKIKELVDKEIDPNKRFKLQDTDFNFNLVLESLKQQIIILTRYHTQGERTATDKHGKAKYADDHIEELKDDQLQSQLRSNGKPKILSITESNLEKYTASDIIRYTQDNVLAVYPNPESKQEGSEFNPESKQEGSEFNPESRQEGSEFDLNYDPLISWTRGAQMVAFNMQDYGKHLWIMQGLFRAQGGKEPTGYVKKPEILTDPAKKFDPTAWRPVKKILKVKVYHGTGWHLDFGGDDFDVTSKPDFFTAVEIVGVPADEAREKTVPAMDNWVPVWDQEFEFPLTVPELAMLVIEVREFDTDRTHDFGGQTCLPVCKLRTGIRSVPLYDKFGKAYRAARLLMRFQLD